MPIEKSAAQGGAVTMCIQMASAWQQMWCVLGFAILFFMRQEAMAAPDDPEPLIFVEEGRIVYWAKSYCDNIPKNGGSDERLACTLDQHAADFVQRLKIEFSTNSECKGVTVTFIRPKDSGYWRLWVNFVPEASGQDWGLVQSGGRYPEYYQRHGTVKEIATAACEIALRRGANMR